MFRFLPMPRHAYFTKEEAHGSAPPLFFFF
jgi:hypothetical protein